MELLQLKLVVCLKSLEQVNGWLKVLSQNFGNSKLDEVVIFQVSIVVGILPLPS